MNVCKCNRMSGSKGVSMALLGICVSMLATGCLLFEEPDFYAGKTEEVIVDTDSGVCDEEWTGDNCDICPPNFQETRTGCSVCADSYLGDQCEFLEEVTVTDTCAGTTTLEYATDPSTGFHVLMRLNGSNLAMDRCTDAACTSVTSVDVELTEPLDYDFDFAITKAGNPIFVYTDYGDETITAVFCGDASCITNETKLLETGKGNPDEIQIVLRDGLYPMIAYQVSDEDVLDVMHCIDTDCNQYEVVTVEEECGGGYISGFDIDDISPFLVYKCGSGISDNAPSMARCSNDDCSGVDDSFDFNFILENGGINVATLPGQDTVAVYAGETEINLLRYSQDTSRFMPAGVLESGAIAATRGMPRLSLNSEGIPRIVRATADGVLLIKCLDINCESFEENEFVFTQTDNYISIPEYGSMDFGIAVTDDLPFIYTSKLTPECSNSSYRKGVSVTYACTNENCI